MIKNLKIEYTDKEISPWGGISLLGQLLDKMQFSEALFESNLPQQESNRGYKPEQLLTNFMVGVWCGANCFEHMEVTRRDHVIGELFGWQQMPGHRAFQRYFNKFNQAKNQEVFTSLYRWFFNRLQFDNYTIDFDSTILTRYGDQQGAKKGYNANKPGRKSHHPLLAFISDIRMVGNLWLRSGDSYSSTNFIGFLADTIHKLGYKTLGLMRADSGFYSNEILSYLENGRQKPIQYIIAVKQYAPIQRKLASQKTWLKLGRGVEIAETMYQASEQHLERRLIMVRREIDSQQETSGKSLRLFKDEKIYKNYRYSCYVTNLTLPVKAVYDLYRSRADAENRIKEIKYDFGAGSFNMHDFWATEATLNMVMMAYNIMSLFRQVVMGTKVQHFMKTLRYRVFAVGSYLIKEGNQRILKLSLTMKRREWFTGLWQQNQSLHLPLKMKSSFPNE